MPNLPFISTENLSAILYSLAAVAQLISSGVALYQIKKINQHRVGWILLSLGLTLMLFRRVGPLYQIFDSGFYSLFDAKLSLLISLCLMIGVLKIQRMFDYLQKQEKKLEQLAKFDFLTGALSRYAIMDHGRLEVERCLRLRKPITILLIDIDKFKNINDRFGHSTGDEVLIEIVQICKNSLRQIDLFGRIGGDEFLAILPDSSFETGTQIATRLKSEVASSSCKSLVSYQNISVSVGIACIDTFQNSTNKTSNAKEILDNLIHTADLKMYENKTT